ncbi:MAG: hypothetical protein ACHQ49_00785 [Elusimicrobiota bacterium]
MKGPLPTLNVPLSRSCFELKRGELEFLADYSRTRLDPAAARKWTYADLVAFKLSCREAIHRRPRGFLGETRLHLEPEAIGGFGFDYTYQRIDLAVKGEATFERLYPLARTSFRRQRGALLGSCQAGLTNLFKAIEDVYGKLPVLLWNMAYYETYGYFAGFHWPLARDERRPFILYVDSSTWTREKEGFFRRGSLGNARLVVLDSTCFGHGDPLFDKILRRLKQLDVPIVLLRSSMKLDSLAMEFGRFGSAVFLAPRSAAKSEELAEGFQKNARFFGSLASSRQIYPFYGETRFLELSRAWARRLKKANHAVADALGGPGARLELRRFEHGLYFWLMLERGAPSLAAATKLIALGLYLDKIPILPVASYPWDFVSITSFSRTMTYYEGQGARDVIRVSCPDFDDEMIARTRSSLARILNNEIWGRRA